MTSTMSVVPWATYSDDGTGPFWRLRIASPRFNSTLDWAAHLGRFVNTTQARELYRRDRHTFVAAAMFMADFCDSSRDKKRPERDKSAGQGNRDNRDSLARAGTLRVEVSLSRSGHNERDGTENRDTSSNGDGLGRDRFASRPGRAWA